MTALRRCARRSHFNERQRLPLSYDGMEDVSNKVAEQWLL